MSLKFITHSSLADNNNFKNRGVESLKMYFNPFGLKFLGTSPFFFHGI